MFNLLPNFTNEINTIMLMMAVINGLVHLLFAGAVAKDAGHMLKLGQPTSLVNGLTWAFATLVGGVFVAGVYWFIHHSRFKEIVK